jgi:ABC-type lipoprotein export system ATPase subunit
MINNSNEIILLEYIKKIYISKGVKHQVLKGTCLRVQKGEFIVIIGPSGSGKTTILNLIGGLDQDYEGKIIVDKKDLKSLNDKELSSFRNQTIGYIFQAFHLIPHLTSKENVLLPFLFTKRDMDPDSRVSEVLERVGMLDKSNHYPYVLSGGQKQRIAIARAIFNKPKILLCDEPTGNLDVNTGQKILELFKDLNKRDGITILVVTHEENISRAASRILYLEDGKLKE